MGSSLIYLVTALLGVVLPTPITALADTAAAPASASIGTNPAGSAAPAQVPAGSTTVPSCADPIQPKAADNPRVSIVLDSRTAWQPRGGTVTFTVSGNNVSLDGVKVIVCFGWPAPDWKNTQFLWEGRVSLSKFDTNSATYSVVVPDLPPAGVSWIYRTALWTVPLAAARIMAYGGVATPTVDVQPYIGITWPLLALLLAGLAVTIAFGVFYVFARQRGVPGKGLVLWMISTRNGVASLSQAQIVLWTFLIGALAVYVMALSGVLIDITDSTLVLLGIAGVATVGSKLQNSQQDAKGTNQTDGTTAVPGKVLSLVQVGTATDSEVRLAWTPPTTGGPVTRYVVEYQPAPAAGAPANPVWSTVGETIILPHHTVLGLAPASNYQFRVSAVNAGGPGDPTDPIGPIQTQPQAAPPAGAPGLPGGLHLVGAPTLTAVKLAWSPADGAPTRYTVQYRRHDTLEAWAAAPQPPPRRVLTGALARGGWGGGARDPSATQPEYTVGDLSSGVAYDFRVAAVNATGEQGLWSAVITARTLRNPEWADLVVIGDGRGEVDVTRAQMLFFTLVAATFVGMKVLTSYIIPDIPQGILLLIGISNGVYMAAKFIPG
jgi:hypothetical protein